MITRDNLAAALKDLGYARLGTGKSWSKAWPEMEAEIVVDGRGIHYPEALRINRRTTTNLGDNENFVVLACVTMLLEKGYRPESLELEREWQLGHDQKGGRADICIDDIRNDGRLGDTLAIIECKTPGEEFRGERRNMLADGGQLFSYWQQERATQWLALFTADLVEGRVTHEEVAVRCSDDENLRAIARRDDTVRLYEGAHTVAQLYQVWSETYDQRTERDVLLGPRSVAYRPEVPPLLKGNLRDFRAEDGIVNKFEEILRHNNVSDKENAFNRLIALFIAKLDDELGKDDDQEVEFAYRQGTDTYETLQDRMQRLHSEGMRELMREDVLYVPDDYAAKALSRYTGQRRKELIGELNDTLRKLKFYTNNDFAFKDVHNEELFMQNGKVLVEVVQLFQPYRIVGSGDLQFLGDLFEQLLSKGFKQNEGQFFTPTPITRFMWRSLPLGEVLDDSEGGVRAPRVIDYACGAGHFLTEGYEEISREAGKDALPSDWARGHLVGVEKDYRLARVSRVALYMHGAGDGEVVFGDGLDNHPDKGIDGRHTSGRFDVLAANPPFSVKGFKPHLRLRENELSVLDEVSDTGSEIETLFVERAAQVVRPGGLAAVILPSSILDKGTSESFKAARDVLLRSFELVSIVRLGSGTFAETGTNVVILFMRRFDEVPTRDASARDFVDAVFDGVELDGWKDAGDFLDYLKLVGCPEEDYFAFTSCRKRWQSWLGVPHLSGYARQYENSADLMRIRRARSYDRLDAEGKARKEDEGFYALAHKQERERLRAFSIVHGIRTLVVNSPTSTSETASFLGYKWSKRKGKEGIQLLDEGGMLYSDDPTNSGEGTISDVIRSWFEGEEAEASDISQHYYYADVERFIDFDGEKFDMTLKMPRAFYRQREFAEGVSVCALGDVATYVTTGVPQTNIDVGSYVTTDNMVKNRGGINPYDGDAPASAGTAYEKGDTLVSNIRPYLQKIWLADHDGTCSKDVLVFRTKDESVLLPEFLYLLLWQKDFFDYDMSTFTGTGRPRGDKGQILGYRIPTPGTDEQCKLFAQFSHLTEEIGCLKAQIATSRTTVDAQFHEMFEREQKHWPTVRLIDCCRNQDDIKCGPFGTQLHKADYQAQGIPVWGIPEVNSGLSKAPTLFISPDKAAALNAYSVVQGDVVVSRKGNVGQAALFREGLEPGIIHSDVLRIRVNGAKLNPEYLVYYLHNSQEVKRQIEVVSSGSIMPGTNVTKLKSVAIVCPPIELQDAFAIFAQGADRKRAELQKRVDMLSQERELLLNQYLA